MQKVKLPKQLDPIKSATKRSEYQGVMLTADMPRLLSTVAGVDDEVDIEVKFLKDEQGLSYFEGQIRCETSLICQRCNGVFYSSFRCVFLFQSCAGAG